MRSKSCVIVGDVFAVPLAESGLAIGQVVAVYGKDAIFLAFFEGTYATDAQVDIERALSRTVVLLGLSFPAKIANGSWKMIRNVEVRADIPLPAYKEFVGTNENVVVVDYSGLRRRPASPQEVQILPNRTVVAPVRLERALSALIGSGEWRSDWDSLVPNAATSARSMFPELDRNLPT